MRITPNLFGAYLKCPTKSFLLARGEAPSGNAYAEWFRSQNEAYRSAGMARLKASVPRERWAGIAPDLPDLKTAKWRLAVDLPAQTPNLESSLHAVERVPAAGRGRHAQFIPTRFVFNNKLSRDDKLVLAFDALVLSEMLGREVSLGKIIHGDDSATLRVKTSALAGDVSRLSGKIFELLSSTSPPDLILNRHCAECEFQARCRQKATESDDLSLLGRMTEKERKKLRSRGIFTVTQLSYTFRPRRRPKRMHDKREKYHHSLKALAIREKKIYIIGSSELKIEGTPVYLDVEGLPDRDFYYLIGVRIGNGESAVQHSLWADNAQGEKQIWGVLLHVLAGIERPVLVHYGSYEAVFLERMCERYGGPLEGSNAAKAITATVDLLSFLLAHFYFPTYSNSLKHVATHLGFCWSEPHPSGLSAIVWHHAWTLTGAPGARRRQSEGR